MVVLNVIVLLILLLWTLALAFLLLTACALQLRARRNLQRLQLQPNCLLTRAPLVFMTGPRSLFYFMQYWNFIPRFLFEHGYLVEVWRMPWRNRNLQRGALIKRLQKRARAGLRPPHLFYDASMTTVVAEALAVIQPTACASLTESDGLLKPGANIKGDSGGIEAPIVDRTIGIDRWIQFGFDLQRRLITRSARAESIGLGSTTPPWQIETRFLRRAVTLAEDEVTNS